MRRVGHEPLEFGGPADKLVTLHAAENLTAFLMAIVVHLEAERSGDVVHMKLDAVLAHSFGSVESAIRRRNYTIRGIDVFPESRNANADAYHSEWLRFAIGIIGLRNTQPHSFRDHARFA